MDIPQGLEELVEQESKLEFENMTMQFGNRLRTVIVDETGEELYTSIVDELNNWDLIASPDLTWREFVQWVWNKIVEWWNSLFN